MEKTGKFPILAQLSKQFLSILTTTDPSERIWSRNAGVATFKQSRMDASATIDAIFLKENEEILRKHYKTILNKASESLLTPLYLPVDVDESKEIIVVVQDVFKLKL